MAVGARGSEEIGEGSNKPDSKTRKKNKMKKLMIAAAAAAVASGAFAICGDPDDAPGSYAQVYKMSFTGKTTAGVGGVDTPNLCGDPTAGCSVRVPANLLIQGWIVLCDPNCASILDGFNAPSYSSFWQVKPYKADIPDGAIEWQTINIIGKKAKDAEAAGKFSGTVTYAADATWALADVQFAGGGKSVNKGGSWSYFSSFSGYFAAAPVASWYIKGNVCEQTHVYDPCDLTVDCEETPNTVAFGKWAMKYDRAASYKMWKNSTRPARPAYATEQGGDAEEP